MVLMLSLNSVTMALLGYPRVTLCSLQHLKFSRCQALKLLRSLKLALPETLNQLLG